MDTKTKRVTRPNLSIVVPTYNAAGQMKRFFASLARQTLPKSRFEVLIVDGGSTDGTRQMARKYRARIIHNPQKLAEPGVALGFEHARGKQVMVLATDNIFVDNNALERMIRIFDDQSIVAAFPQHETARDDTFYSAYINTFTDPYTHFVYGDAANGRTFGNMYRRVTHTREFDAYNFQSSSVYPLIALAQGFTVRKEAFRRGVSDRFDDVLIIYSLIRKRKKIAYAYNIGLFHYTVNDLHHYIRRHIRSIENALVRSNAGIVKRKGFLTSTQQIRSYLFFPYALSVVLPLLQSLIRFVYTGRREWLYHSYLSLVSAIVLLFAFFRVMTRKIFARN